MDTNTPLKLHTHTVAPDGTPAWSKQFLHYIGDIIPNDVREEVTDWWRSEYLVERLKQHFDADTVAAVIDLATHYYDDEAEECDTTPGELAAWDYEIGSSAKLYRRQRQMRRMLRNRFDMPRAYF